MEKLDKAENHKNNGNELFKVLFVLLKEHTILKVFQISKHSNIVKVIFLFSPYTRLMILKTQRMNTIRLVIVFTKSKA